MKAIAVAAQAILCVAAASYPASAAERPKVVVELFTSQGCSSCPLANANLLRIADDPGVLALSFSVTYWDYLGWKDKFGQQRFTDRQIVYEPALGERGPFTPQMVFNGRSTAIGHDLSEVRDFVSATSPLSGPRLILARDHVEIGPLADVGRALDVWLVRYDPRHVRVPVGRGENAGATLVQTNVVHDLALIGQWHGAKAGFELPPADPAFRTAVLVQDREGGPILAAITD